MVRLLQWYEPFEGEVDCDELEDTVRAMIGELKERFTVSGDDESKLHVLDIDFRTTQYLFESDLGAVHLQRVSAVHPDRYEGSQNKFGFGLEGIGRIVQTVRLEGERDLVDDIEMDVEAALGDYGAGLVKGSVDEFLKGADAAKAKKRLDEIDYLGCARVLEASKGALMDVERYEAIRLRCIESAMDELGSQSVVADMKGMYTILKGQYTVLKRRLDALKKRH